GVLVAFCCISIITCLCVCVFTAFHLSYLSTMGCHVEHSTIRQSAPSSEDSPGLPTSFTEDEYFNTNTPVRRNGLLVTPSDRTSRIIGFDDDEDEVEGSGFLGNTYGEDDYVDDTALEFETATLESVTMRLDREIFVNVTSCSCESRSGEWVRTLRYPDLSCLEVNNILPVLFVASCVVTAVGAVLSVLILYLLWFFRNSFYGPAKPHETRPFIFTSNFKNQAKVNNSGVTNGNSRVR
ncbi:hypothetical protein SK128_004353, partial [Halocaridina rubra]